MKITTIEILIALYLFITLVILPGIYMDIEHACIMSAIFIAIALCRFMTVNYSSKT